MVINVNSIQDAHLNEQKIYGCDNSRLRVRTIGQPGNKSLRLEESEGQYSIEIASPKSEAVQKDGNKEGYIEIISGKVKVCDPIQNGRYASINPCDPNVSVYINGNKISSVSIVTEKDSIEFSASVTQASTHINAELSQDRMKAILTINKSTGKQYYVKDTQKTNLLNISSSYKETPAPNVTLAECIAELNKINVDLKRVDLGAVNTLIGQRDGGSVVAAHGKYPVDGSDSIVKYLFRDVKYRNPDFDTDKKIDLLDHTVMPTVKVGEVLAIKEAHAVPGQDGETVTGETVKALQGRDIPFKAGEGSILLGDGTKIVAASSGRPMLTKGTVTVVRQLVIPHDVDPGTGNIYFDGDVQIKGNVVDNMKVVSDGDITVWGNVLQASLSAKGNVDIQGNIISSKVMAGKGAANSLCVLPKVQQILSIIKKEFFDGNSEVWLNGYHNMRQRSPNEFSDRNKRLEALVRDIKTVLNLVSEEESYMVQQILEGLGIVYASGSTVNAKQITKLYDEIQKYVENADNSNSQNADLRFKYAQNSSVQANGDILISDRGTYQTDIIAKNSIVFSKPSSVVRGGLLVAGKKIDMGVVGSAAGIKTYCKVLDENGKIDAVRFYSNTILSINDKKKVIG